jgi:hypothetical protein
MWEFAMQNEKLESLMSQLCLTFAQNKIETNKLSRFCQNVVMTIEEDPMKEQHQEQSSIDRFYNITNDEISTLANAATKLAVKKLHDRGISTYGMRDSIIYETKPNGEKVKTSDMSI